MNCLECDARIEIPADSIVGEIVTCPDCGCTWEIIENEGTLKLQLAESIGEDWGE